MSATHAHPGGLDKHGCHTNRQTGEYHCHRGGTPPRTALTAPAPDQPPASSGPARLDGAGPGRVFRNCDEARAHGAAPVRRGDPGYGPHLDRDNDGVGCEPYRGR
ncbi:excalibur calcium-binding domain-containing protein [Pseudoxanthomonas japonensis]|uniref:excalibur calcium-binding domain-containing protein n=1 Tax=Pseudoxanthomonas japonensis TaxID=69284 RepID=UPI003749EAD5